MTIKNEIRAPWPALGMFERFQNGKWQQSLLNRKIPEFCSVVVIVVLRFGIIEILRNHF